MSFRKVVGEARHFEILQIAEGVYAALAREGTGSMANSGFVDLGESVLVFDSFNTQQAAAELREVITALTGKPVSHLLNSHWHGDHVRGNQAFRDVPIVATGKTKNIMQEIHPQRIARQRAGLDEWREYIAKLEEQRISTVDDSQAVQLLQQISLLREIEISLPMLELVLPSETFESQWYMQGTSRRVECHTLGGGHTASDSFLYVPDAKVCYIGDLVAVTNHMLIVDGEIQNWIGILEQLDRWDIDYVVPGHGPIGGKESISQTIEYLRDLLHTCNAMKQEGFTRDQLDKMPVPDKYKTWAAREVYLRNVQHLMNQ